MIRDRFCCGFLRKLKWAASQEAVTLPWLSAHSIRTGIGGDVLMVDPLPRLSSVILDFPVHEVHALGRSVPNREITLQSITMIDIRDCRMLFLLVL